MPNTEPEHGTLTKLALITERAQREPKCQFTSLAHLLNERFLEHCYHRLGRDRASGIDGVTWKEYGENLEKNLRGLVTRLKAKRYKPLPARRVYIPKDEHSTRPLGLPAVEDKIVQKGIALILEAIYEADFLDCSYGFRPGRSAHQALKSFRDQTMNCQPRGGWVYEVDLRKFFLQLLAVIGLGVRIDRTLGLLAAGHFGVQLVEDRHHREARRYHYRH